MASKYLQMIGSCSKKSRTTARRSVESNDHAPCQNWLSLILTFWHSRVVSVFGEHTAVTKNDVVAMRNERMKTRQRVNSDSAFTDLTARLKEAVVQNAPMVGDIYVYLQHTRPPRELISTPCHGPHQHKQN
ncbi:uncharacterized protein LACBIDRAFT_328690 [Laccaria bicolor S238N-H82]|uniref:Predicted protein n=1 Tax=Laccaria bicolor (strain S238N-H82 / ATCC MYA-4686) TaxID=486041 RepID=B0DFP5_LACBS|nr:uncharacterized protein LACBIDRAFT_328690 [Laccaria bicolor S238N-H82]EDR06382.1 predicted protein [Laccaria bicolor S238N-H82]|eukprot:XP_001882754.1 predicted protein [Laccaria bicolor S238N-H82]